MIFVIGEVLIDQFPTYQRLGGAPLNFAFHLHCLGKSVRLVTRVGNDADGRRILDHLKRWGLSTADVQIDQQHATGRVRVTMASDGSPSFQILTPSAYDYINLEPYFSEEDFDRTELIYFGSLIQRSNLGFSQIRRFLKACSPNSRCFCDINLRSPHYSVEVINHCLKHADILKLNNDELSMIGQILDCGHSQSRIISHLTIDYGLSILALTNGAEGSTVFQKGRRYHAPKPEKITVRDTVGAGDAFAAILAAGILRNRPMRSILSTATDFAAYICSQPGAIPENTEVYKSYARQLGV
jgi:fructokinase